MARPKGSKNNRTIEIERLQQKVYELENSKKFNSYDEVVNSFVDGMIIEMQNNIKTVSLDTLQTWFNNPDRYMEQISNLLTYYYIIDGNMFQLYDLIFSLPDLNYKITAFDKTIPTYKEDMIKIKQALERKVRHKELTRDLLVQLAHDGTLLGTWLGSSKEPYFYTFNNLNYIYPYGRYKGKMIGTIDLKWLDELQEEERQLIYNNLSPLVSESKYKLWKQTTDTKKRKELQYINLPSDKTLVARIHTLNRNQRLGIPFGTQTLFDIQHKQKMKELERSIADKIIRAIAVLKFRGKDDNEVRVKESLKRDVFNKVKKALERNENGKEGKQIAPYVEKSA